MACNCGRKRLATTSANIVADTAGQPTEGARERAIRLATERVAEARASIVASGNDAQTTSAS